MTTTLLPTTVPVLSDVEALRIAQRSAVWLAEGSARRDAERTLPAVELVYLRKPLR